MRDVCKLVVVVISLFSVIIMTTGCSITDGCIGQSIQTQVQLSQANFDVIKSVTGEASATYFFGIGPSQQNLLAQAKGDMIGKAGLEGSQALINVTTDIKHTGFIFYRSKTAYVSAEVVQFK
jgi:hypothetical protein